MNEYDREGDERSTTADLASREARSTEQMRDEKYQGPHAQHPRPQEDGVTLPLLPEDELGRLKTQWHEIMAEFVDEPRHSVEAADGLVASTIKRLAESFAETRSRLESQWSRGDDVSTEDLRLVLRQYHAFFDRLVAV